MTDRPHRHLADELMLQALEFDEAGPAREDAERARLLAAAQVQATLALVDAVHAARDQLERVERAALTQQPDDQVVRALRRRRRIREQVRAEPQGEDDDAAAG